MFFLRRIESGARGQILIVFALALVVMMLFASMVVDVGLLRNTRQNLVNTLDAAALAGGTMLPIDGSNGGLAPNGSAPGSPYARTNALIIATIAANYPTLSGSDYTIEYRCVIGADPASGLPLIARDVPRVCDPSPSKTWTGSTPLATKQAAFTGAGPTRTSTCRPELMDRCNTVLITGSATQDYSFGRVVGINSGSTGAVVSASCNGPCGEPPPPLNDVELVIDTSGSMNGNNSGTPPQPRIYWAKKAANQLVTDLASNGGITPTSNLVGITTFSGMTATVDPTAWTSNAAQLAGKINAITAAGITPLKFGMETGAADLNSHARNAVGGPVKRVIILISDGRPNPDQGPDGLPSTDLNPATNPNRQRPNQNQIDTYLASADVAYSIAIGQGGSGSSQVDLNLMMRLAKADPTANPPGTYFFNVINASSLPAVFNQIAGQILGTGAKLIQLYPTPVITAANSPASGLAIGGTSVTITGRYFTGATSVTFGGVPAASFTVNTDSSISATSPAGTIGTVDIVVTTPGGSTPVRSLDQFTYN